MSSRISSVGRIFYYGFMSHDESVGALSHLKFIGIKNSPVCVICVMMIVGLIGLPSIIRSWSSSSYPYQLAFAQPATTSNTTTGGVAAQGQRPNFLLETRQVVRSRQEKINQSQRQRVSLANRYTE
ncbi:MAG: hypothetical protein WA421_05915 [Nitrososphaeraceae archaeon]